MMVEAGKTPEEVSLTNSWFARWCKLYGVSLKHVNKRFSIAPEDRKRRIIPFLKNCWRMWYYWKVRLQSTHEPVFMSADQMPLHRNETSQQATLNFKGRHISTFVKENHQLSRERLTVMTVVSSKKSITPVLEFVLRKRNASQTNAPGKHTLQWAEKGSYRLEHTV